VERGRAFCFARASRGAARGSTSRAVGVSPSGCARWRAGGLAGWRAGALPSRGLALRAVGVRARARFYFRARVTRLSVAELRV